MCVCNMRVLRSEKMVRHSLTENDQLYGCRGTSKGGGNRPGDGQSGFLSKMGMTVFKARTQCGRMTGIFVCVYVGVRVVYTYTHMHCV